MPVRVLLWFCTDCLYETLLYRAAEYCRNRAPEFFKDTSFYHDIFHGAQHLKCSPVFTHDKTGFSDTLMERKNALLMGVRRSASRASAATTMLLVTLTAFKLNYVEMHTVV